jgi:hypothetical protein
MNLEFYKSLLENPVKAVQADCQTGQLVRVRHAQDGVDGFSILVVVIAVGQHRRGRFSHHPTMASWIIVDTVIVDTVHLHLPHPVEAIHRLSLFVVVVRSAYLYQDGIQILQSELPVEILACCPQCSAYYVYNNSPSCCS